jgi:hypothetical protein
MGLVATNVQILPATRMLLAGGRTSPGGDVNVKVVQTIGGTINLGPASVNASLGFAWPSTAVPLDLILGGGDDLYACPPTATVTVSVLRNRS